MVTRIAWYAYSHNSCSDGTDCQIELSRDVNIDNALDGRPFTCEKCRQFFVPDGMRSKWDTLSTELEPGNLYWEPTYPEKTYWDNHKGPHLMAILPNGDPWCIDSRASNCTMPHDRLHRCWIRTGVPGTAGFNVGKNGHTCAAGQGSILSGNYHGYLRNGEFVQ